MESSESSGPASRLRRTSTRQVVLHVTALVIVSGAIGLVRPREIREGPKTREDWMELPNSSVEVYEDLWGEDFIANSHIMLVDETEPDVWDVDLVRPDGDTVEGTLEIHGILEMFEIAFDCLPDPPILSQITPTAGLPWPPIRPGPPPPRVTALEHYMVAGLLSGTEESNVPVVALKQHIEVLIPHGEEIVIDSLIIRERTEDLEQALGLVDHENPDCYDVKLVEDPGRFPSFDPCPMECAIEMCRYHETVCGIGIAMALSLCFIGGVKGPGDAAACVFAAVIAEGICIGVNKKNYQRCCNDCGTREPPPVIGVFCTPTP